MVWRAQRHTGRAFEVDPLFAMERSVPAVEVGPGDTVNGEVYGAVVSLDANFVQTKIDAVVMNVGEVDRAPVNTAERGAEEKHDGAVTLAHRGVTRNTRIG